MFHMFSLVRFLICSVNRRIGLQKLILLSSKKIEGCFFLKGFSLTWSFWDMMDMSMFRVLVQFRTLWV